MSATGAAMALCKRLWLLYKTWQMLTGWRTGYEKTYESCMN